MKWKLSTSRHNVSSWRELWSGEWSQQPRLRDLSLWAGPPQRQNYSFHSSGWGWNLEPPGWERRSLLTGSSRGPRAMKSSRTRSRQTLSRAPGSRVIRGNAYRRTLGHICTIASSPRGAGCVRENQSGQWDVSLDANRSTCAWPNSLHINSTTSGWSLNSPGLSPCLDRMSVPILWTSGM